MAVRKSARYTGSRTRTGNVFDGNQGNLFSEGTWTPVWTGLTLTAPSTYTQYARYTRIGRMVFFTVRLVSTGGTTYAATKATTYFTLPLQPAEPSNLYVSDGSINNIGVGRIGTSSPYGYVPTWAATASTICIAGFYEV